MLMERVILILRKAAGSALSKMQMDINGRGLKEIFRSITLLLTKLSNSAFSKRER
jgi:hypothetical protein